MGVERRDHHRRAETLKRVTLWISGETSPAREVPGHMAAADAGERILKRLALRGLVRHTESGWMARQVLIQPGQLDRIAPELENRLPRERRGDFAVACARCARPGVIRHENVVQGTVSERHFFCGVCGYRWKVKDRRSKRSMPNRRDRADDRPSSYSTSTSSERAV